VGVGGVRVGVAQRHRFSRFVATVLGGLWAFKWAWQTYRFGRLVGARVGVAHCWQVFAVCGRVGVGVAHC